MKKSTKKSVMTLHVYRITAAGRRVNLSSRRIWSDEPDTRPLPDVWPRCRCPRCGHPDPAPPRT